MLTTDLRGFDKAGELLYLADSRGRDTSALVEVNVETRQKRTLADDPRADAADVVRHPTEKHVQAVRSLTSANSGRCLTRPSSRTG